MSKVVLTNDTKHNDRYPASKKKLNKPQKENKKDGEKQSFNSTLSLKE